MGSDGMVLWRQISKKLASEIGEGVLSPGDRLPASTDLAARFGVNRHTVLKAVSHLQSEGLIRTERGGGIYVEACIPYKMGARNRLEENLRASSLDPKREILSVSDLQAPSDVAKELAIAPGAPIVLVTLIAAANDVPISLNQNFFPTERLPGIASLFRDQMKTEGSASPSTKDVLASLNVTDFRRKSIRINGRQPTQNEERRLRIPPNEWVFEVMVTNVDANNTPITYGISAFCMTRVQLTMDFDEE